MSKNNNITDSVFNIMLCFVQPLHGYAVMNLIRETTNDEKSIYASSLYPTIDKLLKRSLIEIYDDSDSRKKVYILTDLGRSLLEEEFKKRKSILDLAEKKLSLK